MPRAPRPSLFMLVLLSACAGIRVEAEFDPETSFEGLETYARIEQGDSDPKAKEFEEVIHATVDAQLAAKGMQAEARDRAQVLVSEHIRIEARQRFSDPYYSNQTTKTYEEGTLIIDLLDAKSEALIWRGVGRTRVHRLKDASQRQARVQEVVRAILAQYPAQATFDQLSIIMNCKHLAFLPCLLVSCASPEASSPETPIEAVSTDALASDVQESSFADSRHLSGPDAEAPVSEESADSADELSIWRSPRFRERFIESYLAETDIEPRISSIEREVMIEVLDFIAKDEMDQAIALLKENQGEGANLAVFDFTLGNIHFQREEYPEAIRLYELAVSKFEKYLRAWRNLGMSHVRLNDFPAALPALTRVLELGGADALTYGLIGFAYSNQGQDLPAESAYRMATLMDPQTLDWKMGLARSFFNQQRFADAVAFLGDLITDDPDRADLWLLQANAYIGLNQPLAAAENFEMVESLGGATFDSLNNLGDIYSNQELFDLAVDSYLRAMEMRPDGQIDRALRAAKYLTANGALEEAEKLVAGIERIHADKLSTADQIEVKRLRARLALVEGDGEEEARILAEIVELDPLDGEALILLGQYSGRTGDQEKAIYYYERAAQLEDYEADAKVRQGQILVSQGKYQEAIKLLKRAQALKPRENVQEYLDQVERVAGGR